jgi:APA family basic amino acid/polyamine antiporter
MIGALSYGELAGMMPRAGGQYVYLKEAYNPLIGFLFGWTTFLVIQTGTIAAVAVAFARFTGVLFPFFSDQNIVLQVGNFKIATTQLLAVASLIVLTLINLRGVKEAKFVQLLLTVTKTAALLGLILLGFWVGWGKDTLAFNWSDAWTASHTRFLDDARSAYEMQPLSGWSLLSMMGLAMVGPLFSSSAWNNITYTASEIQNPKRNIPLSLFYGTLIVSALYISANVAYQMLLPVAGQPDGLDVIERGIMFATNDRVGTAAAEVIFGAVGTTIMAVFIMISTFGCNNGIILSGARVYYAMAQNGLFFKKAAEVNKNGVPGNSLIVQTIWASLLCLSGTYSDLLDYTVFSVLIFYILTVSGVFILRRKQPDLPRPYRAFGYPLVPAIYVVIAAALCLNLMIFKPDTSLMGLFLVALGIPVFYFWKKK